jgi:hypothetical protein
MEITVQYFEGCPNLRVVTERLAAVGVDPGVVRFVSVASPAEAEAIGFRGSPTVVVDDEDRFAAASAPAGFACRVYRTASGLEGAPSIEQLQAALGQ